MNTCQFTYIRIADLDEICSKVDAVESGRQNVLKLTTIY